MLKNEFEIGNETPHFYNENTIKEIITNDTSAGIFVLGDTREIKINNKTKTIFTVAFLGYSGGDYSHKHSNNLQDALINHLNDDDCYSCLYFMFEYCDSKILAYKKASKLYHRYGEKDCLLLNDRHPAVPKGTSSVFCPMNGCSHSRNP